MLFELLSVQKHCRIGIFAASGLTEMLLDTQTKVPIMMAN